MLQCSVVDMERGKMKMKKKKEEKSESDKLITGTLYVSARKGRVCYWCNGFGHVPALRTRARERNGSPVFFASGR